MAWVRTLLQSKFLAHTSMLMGGTVLAQLIPLAVLPILGRLYSPESFAVLALMMMGASLTVSLSTGNFDQAIPTARSIVRARTLSTIAILLSLGFAPVYWLLLSIFYTPLSQWLALGAYAPWMLAVPLTLCAGSLANISSYWLLRAARPGRQASIKVIHAASNAVLALAFSAVFVRSGLLVAFVLAVILSAGWGLYWSWRCGLRLVHLRGGAHLWRVMRHYRDFPLLGSLPMALNNLAIQVPLILVAAHYSLSTTGHFSITRNLLSGGLILVSFCIGQVLLSHATQRIHQGVRLWPFFIRVMGVTAGLSMAGGVLLYLFGPWFFSIYLGPGWEDSGVILRVLSVSAPFIVLGASAAPALVAMRRLRLLALWQGGFALAAFGLYFFVDLPFESFLWRIVTMECFVYAVLMGLVIAQVRRHDRVARTEAYTRAEADAGGDFVATASANTIGNQ